MLVGVAAVLMVGGLPVLPRAVAAADPSCTTLSASTASAVSSAFNAVVAGAVDEAVASGVKGMFGSLGTRLDDVLTEAQDVPVAGEKIQEAVGAVTDKIEALRSDGRDYLEGLLERTRVAPAGTTGVQLFQDALFLALGPGSTGLASLSSAEQSALQPLRPALVHLGLGVLQDGPDADTTVDADDVVISACEGVDGQRWIRTDVHLGQRYVYDTPAVDLELPVGAAAPALDLALEVPNGVRFEVGWDLRLGFGMSNLPAEDGESRAFFVDAGAVDGAGAPVPELDVSFEVRPAPSPTGAPGIDARAAIGLLQAHVTDGVVRAVTVTAGSPVSSMGSGSGFDLTVDGVTKRIGYAGGAGQTPVAINTGLNRALATAYSPGLPPVDATFEVPESGSPSLQLSARNPSVQAISVSGAGYLGFSSGQANDEPFDPSLDTSVVSMRASIDIVSEGFTGGAEDDDLSTQEVVFGASITDTGTYETAAGIEGRIRLHVSADAENLTDFVAQQLGVGGGLSLPAVEFDLEVDGGVAREGGSGPLAFAVERVRMNHVSLDVGDLIRNVAGPIADLINDTIGPLSAVVGAGANGASSTLNKPLPVISDIVDSDVTLRKILDELDKASNPNKPNPSLGARIQSLIDTISDLATFPAKAAALANLQTIHLGCFEIPMDPTSKAYHRPVPCGLADLVTTSAAAAEIDAAIATDVIPTPKPKGFKFALFTPRNVYNMILGEPVDILSFRPTDPQAFSAGLSFDYDFRVLEFDVDALASLGIDVEMVYDSSGIKQIVDALRAGATPDVGALLDGFYIRSAAPTDDEPDPPEVGATASFHGGAGVCIPGGIFGCGGFDGRADVDIEGNLGLQILDLDDNGKLRYPEVSAITDGFRNPAKVFCLFDVVGGFSASVSGHARIAGQTLVEGEMGLNTGQISLQDLLSSSFSLCQGSGSPAATLPDLPPVLAEAVDVDGQRVLRVNAGPFASARQFRDTTDDDVASTGLTVNVSGSGSSVTVGLQETGNTVLNGGVQSFAGPFARVEVTGTETGDRINGGSLSIPLVAHGGPGGDTITGGSAADELDGGDGNDVVQGGGGNDVVTGGDGDDTADGGGNDDHLDGGVGNDTAAGAGGNDVVEGGPGNDTLGNDVTDSGNDRLVGGDGDDTVNGGAGADTIEAGNGDDRANGGADADAVDGGRGNDILDGGAGEDSVTGDDGDDTAGGGAGNDQVIGDRGDDSLDGGADNDALRGGTGRDTLTGSAGADSFGGGDGADAVNAGPGDTSAQGDEGDDDLRFDSTGIGPQALTARAASLTTPAGTTASTLFETLTLTLGNGADVFTVDGPSIPTTARTRAGGATVQLVSVQVPVVVDGGATAETVVVDRTAQGNGVTGTLDGTTLTGFGWPASATFSGVDALEIRTGFGNDVVTVRGSPATTSTAVRTGDGDDVMTIPLRAGLALGAVSLNGDAGHDRAVLDSSALAPSAIDPVPLRSLGFGGIEELRVDATARGEATKWQAKDGQVLVETSPGVTKVVVESTAGAALTTIAGGTATTDDLTVADDNVVPQDGRVDGREVHIAEGFNPVDGSPVLSAGVPTAAGLLPGGSRVASVNPAGDASVHDRDGSTGALTLQSTATGAEATTLPALSGADLLNPYTGTEFLQTPSYPGGSPYLSHPNITGFDIDGDWAVLTQGGSTRVETGVDDGFNSLFLVLAHRTASGWERVGSRIYCTRIGFFGESYPGFFGHGVAVDDGHVYFYAACNYNGSSGVYHPTIEQLAQVAMGTLPFGQLPYFLTGFGSPQAIAASGDKVAVRPNAFRGSGQDGVFIFQRPPDGNNVVFPETPWHMTFNSPLTGVPECFDASATNCPTVAFAGNLVVAGDYSTAYAGTLPGTPGAFEATTLFTKFSSVSSVATDGRHIAVAAGTDPYSTLSTHSPTVVLFDWQASTTSPVTQLRDTVAHASVPAKPWDRSVDFDGKRLVVGGDEKVRVFARRPVGTGATGDGTISISPSSQANGWFESQVLTSSGFGMNDAHFSDNLGAFVGVSNAAVAGVGGKGAAVGRDLSGVTTGAVAPAGADNLYAIRAGQHPSLLVFRREADGLHLLEEHASRARVNGVVDAGLDDPKGVAVSPDGTRVFVTTGNAGMAQFSRDTSTGALTFTTLHNVAATGRPTVRDANRVYGVAHSPGRLISFNLTAGTTTTVSGFDRPAASTLSPDGTHLYVVDPGSLPTGADDSLWLVPVATNGTLGAPVKQATNGQAGVRGLGGANDVAVVGIGGRFVVASGRDDDSLAVFERNATTGALTFRQRVRNGSDGVGGMDSPEAIMPTDADHFYVASRGTGVAGGGINRFTLSAAPAPAATNIRFSGVEALAVRSADEADTWRVGEPGVPATLRSLGGDDVVEVAKTATPALTVQLGDGDDAATVRRTAGAAVTVEGGAGSDAVLAAGTDAGPPLVLRMGTENDTVTVNAPRLGGDVDPADGAGGDDTLVVQAAAQTDLTVRDGAGALGSVITPPLPAGSVQDSHATGTTRYGAMEHVLFTAPPIAHAGGPYTLAEGGSLTLSSSGTLIPAGQTVTSYEWDLDGDAVADATGASPVLSWTTLRSLGIDDDGAHIVTLEVTSAAGASSTHSTTATVTNVAPTVALAGAAAVDQRASYPLTLVVTDPGADTIAEWTVGWGDGTTETIRGNPPAVRHTYTMAGSFTISVGSVTDEDGTATVSPAATKALTVNPVAPVHIAGASTAAEGSGYALTLSGPPGITGWLVSWGDGSSSSLSGAAPPATHVYDGPDIFTISALATVAGVPVPADGSVVVDVAGVAPTLSATGLAATDEGPFLLSLGAIDPGPDAITDWTIDWGDGTKEHVVGPPAPLVHTFSPGPFTIRATATDEDGTYAAPPLAVAIANVAPTLTTATVETASPAEGGATAFLLNAIDPGPEALRYQLDFDGDGTFEVETGTGAAQHAFPDDGTYPVVARAVDRHGGVAPHTFIVAVGNVAPALRLGVNGAAAGATPEPAVEGTPVVLDVEVADPGTDLLADYRVDWGDGTVDPMPGGDRAPTHTYAEGAAAGTPRTIRVFDLTDEDGTHGTEGRADVVVANAPPVVSLSSVPAEPRTGKPFTLTVTATDPSAADQAAGFTFDVDWDADGTVDATATGASPMTFTHPTGFGTIGDHPVVVGARDHEGAVGPATITLNAVQENDPPVAVDDTLSIAEEGTGSVDVLANDSPGPVGEGDQHLVASIAGTPAAGTATLDGGTITYLPDADFNGTDELQYEVCDDGWTGGAPDPKCSTATLVITVTPVNDAPVAGDLAVPLAEDDAPIGIDLGAVVADVETADAALVYEVVTPPTKGVLSGTGPVLTYDSNDDVNGTDSFTYRVTDRGDPDGCGAAGPACRAALPSTVRTVTISIAAVNDLPWAVFAAPAPVQHTDALGPLAISGADVDHAATSLQIAVTGLPAGLAYAPTGPGTGTVTGKPTVGAGTYTATVRVTDPAGGFSQTPLPITVTHEDALLEYSGSTVAPAGTAMALRATVRDSAAVAGYTGPRPEIGGSRTLGDLSRMWVAFDVFLSTSCGTGSPLATRYGQAADTGTTGDGIGTASSSYTSSTAAQLCVVARLVAGGSGGTNGFYAAAPTAPVPATFSTGSASRVATGSGSLAPPSPGGGSYALNAGSTKRGAPTGSLSYSYTGTYNGVSATFTVTSAALTGVAFSPAGGLNRSCTVQGRGTVRVVARSGQVLVNDKTATFSAVALDAGPGQGPDTLALTVWDGSGVVVLTLPATPVTNGAIVVT